MNLHLLPDDKFSDGAIALFEKYSKGTDIYISSSNPNKELKYIKDSICLNLSPSEIINYLRDNDLLNSISKVFVHYLNQERAQVAIDIKDLIGSKIYWIFYGGDMYSILYKRNNYKLYDSICLKDFFYKAYWKCKGLLNQLLSRDYFTNFIRKFDYFCYWDIYDFKLLQRYYPNHAEFKYFAYAGTKEFDLNFSEEKQHNLVLVGNNCKRAGNHLTILKRLREIDAKEQLELLLPMSYGDIWVKNKVKKYLDLHFHNRYTILDGFMEYEEYLKTISKANSSIFGFNRQAAGGNIFTMIKFGSKVFLREKNNVISVLQDSNCISYTFERDLNSVDKLLTPLSADDIIRNFNNCPGFPSISQIDDYMKKILE